MRVADHGGGDYGNGNEEADGGRANRAGHADIGENEHDNCDNGSGDSVHASGNGRNDSAFNNGVGGGRGAGDIYEVVADLAGCADDHGRW